MKIMLAKPVATEKTHRPLQNRPRPTEAIQEAIPRFQPINVAKCPESTRQSEASFYSEEFRSGVRDRSLDRSPASSLLAGREDSQDRTSGSGAFVRGETRRSWVQIPPVPHAQASASRFREFSRATVERIRTVHAEPRIDPISERAKRTSRPTMLLSG
jgi:hypothetical protein